MLRRELRRGDVDLFQFAQQPLRLGELRKNRIVRLGKFVRRRARELDQAFAAARKFVALLNLFFFASDEIRRVNLGSLMTKEIELLLARGLGGVERGVLGRKRLKPAKMFLIFCELLLRSRE